MPIEMWRRKRCLASGPPLSWKTILLWSILTSVMTTRSPGLAESAVADDHVEIGFAGRLQLAVGDQREPLVAARKRAHGKSLLGLQHADQVRGGSWRRVSQLGSGTLVGVICAYRRSTGALAATGPLPLVSMVMTWAAQTTAASKTEDAVGAQAKAACRR